MLLRADSVMSSNDLVVCVKISSVLFVTAVAISFTCEQEGDHHNTTAVNQVNMIAIFTKQNTVRNTLKCIRRRRPRWCTNNECEKNRQTYFERRLCRHYNCMMMFDDAAAVVVGCAVVDDDVD